MRISLPWREPSGSRGELKGSPTNPRDSVSKNAKPLCGATYLCRNRRMWMCPKNPGLRRPEGGVGEFVLGVGFNELSLRTHWGYGLSDVPLLLYPEGQRH